jgi:hypothetical protein
VLVLLMLLGVGLLLAPRVPTRDPVERLAWGLLGAMVAAPLLAVAAAWGSATPLSPGLVAGCALVVGVAAAPGWWRGRSQAPLERVTGGHVALLAGAAVVAAVTAAHHSDAEVLLSLASFVERGEAECFYMQSFALVDELRGASPAVDVRDAWSIISVPTNVVFTAPLLPMLDGATFRVVDALTRALLFRFLASLLSRRGAPPGVALGVAGVALLNPAMLGVEVLDRNVLAAMLSAALLLSLATAPRHALLHGALLGLTAGTGLRFLPVVFVIPVLLHHGRDLPRALPRLAGGAALTIAIALPHLARHGLHSLGETESLLGLAVLTLRELPRAPLTPYPAGPLHLLDLASRLGLLAVGGVLGGAWILARRDRRDAWGLILPVALGLGVLSVQRDWLQWDKLRIPLSLMVPAALLLGTQVDGLRRDPRSAGLALLGGVALASAAALGLAAIDGPPDPTAGARHPVYATETPRRMAPARAALRPGLLPGVHRLATKGEWGRKRRQEQALRGVLLAPGSPTGQRARAAGWTLGGPAPGEPTSRSGGPSVDVAIDLERLPDEPERAVTRVQGEEPWLDTTHPEVLDVLHRAARVGWQPEELNVTALPLGAEARAMDEAVIELDAFTGDGLTPDGLRRIVPIHRAGRGDRGPGALTAVPDPSASPRIVVRVRVGQRIVVRQWVIDGVRGTPHRVDAWLIDTADGVSVRFALGEPESYL